MRLPTQNNGVHATIDANRRPCGAQLPGLRGGRCCKTLNSSPPESDDAQSGPGAWADGGADADIRERLIDALGLNRGKLFG